MNQQQQQVSFAICLYFIYQAQSMKSDFNAPNQDINRGTEKQCHDCQKKFSIVNREHQCKRCLKPICSDCGSHRRQVYGSIFEQKMHKVCKSCKQLSSFISQLVKSQNLGFGKMSDTGKKWIKKITSKPSIFGTDTSQHKTLSRQVFNQLWGSYSYQLRQLVGNLTFKFQQDGVYNVVYGVYTTVISSVPHYKFGQIIHLVVFVLCFCSADKAPFIVLYLIELKDSIKKLKEMMNNYLKVLPFRHQISKIGDYINYRYDRYIDSFLVNCLTVQCSIAMISKIIERKSVEDLLITFTSHIFANKDILLQKCQQKNGLLDHLMLRKCLPQQFITVSKYFKGKNLVLISPEVINQSQKNLKKNGQYSQSFQLSPKIQVFQQVDAKIKLNLIQRQSYGQNQNNINNEDSFSIHISPNSMNDFNNRNLSPQNFSKGNKLHEQYLQYSPQNSNFSRNSKQGISPRKPAQEEFEVIDINKNKQVSKVHRKYTEVSQEQTMRQCEKCVQIQKYYEKQAQKIKISHQQLQSSLQRVKQQKQSLKSQEYIRKSKIIELQSIKSSQQHKIKQLNTNLKQLYEKTASQSQTNKKLQSQLKNFKDKLLNQTNETIKLHTQLQQQKRNVKQARQICLQTSKQNDQLNIKIQRLQTIYKDLLLQNEKQIIINKKNEEIAENLKKKLIQYERRQEQYVKTKQQSTEWQNIYKEIINKNNKLKQNLSEYEKSQQQAAKLMKQKEYIISDMEQKSITLSQVAQQRQNSYKTEIETLRQRLRSLQSLHSPSAKQQNEDHKIKQRLMFLQNNNYELKIQNSKLQQEISLQTTLLYQKEREANSLLLQKDEFIQKLKQVNDYYKKSFNDKDQQIKRLSEENNRLKQQNSKVVQNTIISQSQMILNSKIKVLQLQNIDLQSKLARLDKENHEYRQTVNGLMVNLKQAKDQDKQLKSQIIVLKRQLQNNQISLSQLPLQLQQKQTQISNFKKQLSSLSIIQRQRQRQRVQKRQLYRKLQEISSLMMKIQQQKMQIADQLFQINEFLKNKGIEYY